MKTPPKQLVLTLLAACFIAATAFTAGFATASKRFVDATREREGLALQFQIFGLNALREGRTEEGIRSLEYAANSHLGQAEWHYTLRDLPTQFRWLFLTPDESISTTAIAATSTYVESYPTTAIRLSY